MEKYKVEIIDQGCKEAILTLQEIKMLQNQGYVIAIQIANCFEHLNELSEIKQAKRILALRPMAGG